jgi:hypothetical protein
VRLTIEKPGYRWELQTTGVIDRAVAAGIAAVVLGAGHLAGLDAVLVRLVTTL